MNKNDNSDDDNYYEQFKFLKNSETKKEKDINSNHFQAPRIKGAMTVDQLKNPNLDITSGVKSVMEEDFQSNFGDSLIMRKTEGQKMIESPELNKKIRTQIDYREAMKGNLNSKKTVQDEITFNQSNLDFLLTKDEKYKLLIKEMKKTLLEKVENNQDIPSYITTNEILKDKEKENLQNFDHVDNSPMNSNESKLKVYRVKKKKIISDRAKEQEQESNKEKKLSKEIPKNENNSIKTNSIMQYYKLSPYIYTSSLFFVGSLFLFKLYKKFKK
jgi:hypothetical protein